MNRISIFLRTKVVRIKNKIYIYSRKYCNDSRVIELHSEIVKISKKILSNTDIRFSDKVSKIAYIKLYAYHTNFDKSSRQVLCLSCFFTKVTHIAFSFVVRVVSVMVGNSVRNLKGSFLSKKLEDDIDFSYENIGRMKEIPFTGVDVVFVASMSSYLGFVLDLAPKLGVSYLIFTTNKAIQGIDSGLINENVYSIEEYLSSDLRKEFFSIQKLSCDYFRNNTNSINKLFKQFGINFYPMYSKSLINVWRFLIPQSYIYYKFMNNLVKEVRPKHVIGVRVRRIFERACYLAARDNGITTNVILHSAIGMTIDDYYLTGNFDIVDNAFVWGEANKSMIDSDNLSKGCKVHVVGSINFTKENHDFSIDSNSNSNKFKILFAATRVDFKEIRSLIKVITGIDNVELVIKLHPNYHGSEYDQFSDINFVRVESEKIPIEKMMSGIDLFVTTMSGSHMHAAICKIPIMLIAYDSIVREDLKEIYGLHYKAPSKKGFLMSKESELLSFMQSLIGGGSLATERAMIDQNMYISNAVRVRTNAYDVTNNIKEILEL